MWLITKFGFFSIVRKTPRTYHVRARDRHHLELLTATLAERYGARVRAEQLEIRHDLGTDYAARIVVNVHTVRLIQETLAETLDYANFKDEIHRRPELATLSAKLPGVWSTLLELQTGRRAPLLTDVSAEARRVCKEDRDDL